MLSFFEGMNLKKVNLFKAENLGFDDNERGYILLLNSDKLTLDDLRVLRDFALEKNKKIIENEETIKRIKERRKYYNLDDDLIAASIVDIYRNQELIKMVEKRIAGQDNLVYPKDAEYYFKKIIYLNKKIALARKENKGAECEYLYVERDEAVCLLGNYKYNIVMKNNKVK